MINRSMAILGDGDRDIIGYAMRCITIIDRFVMALRFIGKTANHRR